MTPWSMKVSYENDFDVFELTEAENSFAEEQVKEMIRDLKEKGIINFLRAYLAMGENGEMASLRKLLLGFGIIPVSGTSTFACYRLTDK